MIKNVSKNRYNGQYHMRLKNLHPQANTYINELQSRLIQSNWNDSYVVNEGTEGVLYVGGGKYWPGIVVGCKLLRRLGYTGAIEIWYRGKVESINVEDIVNLNVRLYDISIIQSTFNDFKLDLNTYRHGGWCAKLYALMHTGLEKVLYLDADAYCVNNPEKLFELLDTYSFVYWKDLPNQANSIRWHNVLPSGYTSNVPQVQGGQLLINRSKASNIIRVSNYLCENADYYFNQMYGDQDTWRISLAGLEEPSYKCLGKAEWRNIAFECCYNNYSYIIHRCKGKLFDQKDIPLGKTHYSNPQYYLPRETEVFDLFAETLNKCNRDSANVFNSIYSRKLWGNHASESGAGSTLKESQEYIDYVNDLIRSKGYETVVDAGCGDGLVGSKIECKEYVGYECATAVIDERNIKSFSQIFNIFPLDIYKNYDIMKMGDILLCKDVLHHWPNEWITKWLTYLIESKKWKTIVLCNDRKQIHDNQDCHLGGYRALNHAMSPLKGFSFKLAKEYLHKEILIWEG